MAASPMKHLMSVGRFKLYLRLPHPGGRPMLILQHGQPDRVEVC